MSFSFVLLSYLSACLSLLLSIPHVKAIFSWRTQNPEPPISPVLCSQSTCRNCYSPMYFVLYNQTLMCVFSYPRYCNPEGEGSILSLCIVGSQQVVELGKFCVPIFTKNIPFMSNRKAFEFLCCADLKNCCSISKKHLLSNNLPDNFPKLILVL